MILRGGGPAAFEQHRVEHHPLHRARDYEFHNWRHVIARKGQCWCFQVEVL